MILDFTGGQGKKPRLQEPWEEVWGKPNQELLGERVHCQAREGIRLSTFQKRTLADCRADTPHSHSVNLHKFRIVPFILRTRPTEHFLRAGLATVAKETDMAAHLRE